MVEQASASGSEMEKKVQEKLLAYRALESRLSALANQQNMFASKILEIQSTIESINEIDKGKETKDILFPLGSAAYVKGTVADKNKMVVEVGSGVALEKTAEQGKAILEKRKKEIESAMDVLQKDMQSIASTMRKIEVDTQAMVSGAQKGEEKFKVVSPE